MEKINIGFIGCGKIAQKRHIPEASKNENVNIVAYCNRTVEKAEEMADMYGGSVYSNYQEILNDSGIDAVVISVANILHGEIAIEALKKGKHVLCEKPMATTLEESIEMVKVSKDTGKVLNIAHNQRLKPIHLEAKKLIRDGAIGKVLTFSTIFGNKGPEEWSSTPGKDVWFFYEDAAGIGVMGDLGIHKIDLISYLLDEKVIEVMSMMETLDKKSSSGDFISVDDNGVSILKLSNNIMGTMSVSWTHYGAEDKSTIIYGKKGIMYIYDDPNNPLKVINSDGKTKIYKNSFVNVKEEELSSGVMDVFIKGILNEEDTILSGEKILPAMRAVFASEESYQNKKLINIPENKRIKI
ncbi:MAG: Gfo/Idh/MocA family oxidoreductase [Clostridium sp.]|nr:Gfo/Idh/MocA family oxidoreductase [Clostridium sp.]